MYVYVCAALVQKLIKIKINQVYNVTNNIDSLADQCSERTKFGRKSCKLLMFYFQGLHLNKSKNIFDKIRKKKTISYNKFRKKIKY